MKTKEEIKAELLSYTNKINELNKEYNLVINNEELQLSEELIDIFKQSGFKLSQIKKEYSKTDHLIFEYNKIIYDIDYSGGNEEIICSFQEIIDCDYSIDFLNENFEQYCSIENIEDFFLKVKEGGFDTLRIVWLELDKIENKYSSKLPIDFEELIMQKYSLI
jgi:hypothetical protein